MSIPNLNIRYEHWMDSAACGGQVDDWLFFDHSAWDQAAALEEARKLCGGCSVAASCLEYALADKVVLGIWAGTTYEMRRKLRRKENVA